MRKSTKAIALLLAAGAIASFAPQNNDAMIKGKLKTINNYTSGTRTSYFYDNEGRFLLIEMPYGKKVKYSYYANMVFTETIDPRGYNRHDTSIIKSYSLVDSILSDRWYSTYGYNSEGKVTSAVYAPVKGKKRKAGNPTHFYSYEYYPTQCDTPGTDYKDCMAVVNSGRTLLKKLARVNAQGDTTLCFKYRYEFNNNSQIKTRTKYYSNGQLYDSVGFVYY